MRIRESTAILPLQDRWDEEDEDQSANDHIAVTG